MISTIQPTTQRTIQQHNAAGKITTDEQKMKAIDSAINIFKGRGKGKDEFLLVYLLANYFNKEKKLRRELYTILTKSKWENDDEPALFVEAEPLNIREDEGNTCLDLAMGGIKYRGKTKTGIEFDKSKESFLFCEAKWESDISWGVSKCSKRNQFQRIIETALYFTDSAECKEIFVTLLTPQEYFPVPSNNFGSRLYYYKYKEYKNDIKIFNQELKEVDNYIKLKDEFKKNKINFSKLKLNWVTFENLFDSLEKSIPNFKNYIEKTIYSEKKNSISIKNILESLNSSDFPKIEILIEKNNSENILSKHSPEEEKYEIIIYKDEIIECSEELNLDEIALTFIVLLYEIFYLIISKATMPEDKAEEIYQDLTNKFDKEKKVNGILSETLNNLKIAQLPKYKKYLENIGQNKWIEKIVNIYLVSEIEDLK